MGDGNTLLGHTSWYQARDKVVLDNTFVHCVTHHEDLASKIVSPELMKAFRQVIYIVSTVK